MSPAESTFTAWAAALDALEGELEWARDLDRPGASAWSAPAGLGPIPAELLDRAKAIQASQRELTERLLHSHGETARHLAAVRTVPAARPHTNSVYLDVAG